MLRSAILVVLLSFSITASADFVPIRVICAYEYSINEKLVMTDSSGETLITVLRVDSGVAVIKKENLDALFTGTLTEDEIFGETEYQLSILSTKKIRETLKINRFTGAFQLSHFMEPDGYVWLYGKCRQFSERLF